MVIMSNFSYSRLPHFLSPENLPFSQNIPQVPKQLFTAKLAFSNHRYAELDFFRQQIEQSRAGFHHQPYTNNKKAAWIYKSIFFGFSILFLVLALASFKLSVSLSFTLFFSSYILPKGIIATICSLFTLSSLMMALAIRSEREAVLRCIRQAKSSLTRIYARKRIRMGIKSCFAILGHQRQRYLALRHLYQEAYDKIQDKKEEALHLVARIATASTLNKKEKEDLLNQAVEELHDKLMLLSHAFRHSTLPYIKN